MWSSDNKYLRNLLFFFSFAAVNEEEKHAMTLPAPLHVRPSVLARVFPFLRASTTPESPRQLQRLLSTNLEEGGDNNTNHLNTAANYSYRQVPRNLEDVVGAVGRWFEGRSDSTGGARAGSRSTTSDRWRKWTSRAPLIGKSRLLWVPYNFPLYYPLCQWPTRCSWSRMCRLWYGSGTISYTQSTTNRGVSCTCKLILLLYLTTHHSPLTRIPTLSTVC